jgi:hypothetical protein
VAGGGGDVGVSAEGGDGDWGGECVSDGAWDCDFDFDFDCDCDCDRDLDLDLDLDRDPDLDLDLDREAGWRCERSAYPACGRGGGVHQVRFGEDADADRVRTWKSAGTALLRR